MLRILVNTLFIYNFLLTPFLHYFTPLDIYNFYKKKEGVKVFLVFRFGHLFLSIFEKGRLTFKKMNL